MKANVMSDEVFEKKKKDFNTAFEKLGCKETMDCMIAAMKELNYSDEDIHKVKNEISV